MADSPTALCQKQTRKYFSGELHRFAVFLFCFTIFLYLLSTKSYLYSKFSKNWSAFDVGIFQKTEIRIISYLFGLFGSIITYSIVLYYVALLHKYPVKRERERRSGGWGILSSLSSLRLVVFNKWTVLVILEYWTASHSICCPRGCRSAGVSVVWSQIWFIINPIGVVQCCCGMWCGVVWCERIPPGWRGGGETWQVTSWLVTWLQSWSQQLTLGEIIICQRNLSSPNIMFWSSCSLAQTRPART